MLEKTGEWSGRNTGESEQENLQKYWVWHGWGVTTAHLDAFIQFSSMYLRSSVHAVKLVSPSSPSHVSIEVPTEHFTSHSRLTRPRSHDTKSRRSCVFFVRDLTAGRVTGIETNVWHVIASAFEAANGMFSVVLFCKIPPERPKYPF